MMQKEPTILQLAAMDAFAQDGYAGTSMRTIAAAAEIRASSVYSHFSGKDELFLSLIPIALAQELTFANEYFEKTKEKSARDSLSGYLSLIPDRYKSSASARFVLSVKYFPPKQHIDTIYELVNGHLSALSRLFEAAYARAQCSTLTPDIFAEAYLSCVESIESELIYTGMIAANRAYFSKRLEAIEALLDLAFGVTSSKVH